MPSDLSAAFAQTWPPFALVAGLLLLGAVADREGLFAWLGRGVQRRARTGVGLAAGLYLVTAAVTAVLNLDTAVAFVAPVAVHACRHRGVDPVPVAVGVLLMANASSLLLPGANLTNLLVLADAPIGGHRWLVEIAPAGAAAALVTAAGLLVLDRRRLAAAPAPTPAGVPARADAPTPASAPTSVGGAAAPAGRAAEGPAAAEDAEAPRGVARPPWPVLALPALAGAAILALPAPAAPVLGLGVAAAALAVGLGRLAPTAAARAVGPVVLVGLLVAATALGWLARSWDAPARLVADLAPLPTAGLGALAAVLVNNLPAAALLAARPPAHPEALLVGLNLGPNLLPSGSLAAWIWWRASRTAGAPVTVRAVLRRGPVLAALGVVAAVALLPG